MEIAFMDKTYNTTRIIDAYISCIWSDQYLGYGDFELYFPMDYGALDGIEIGYYARIKESDRYMIVEGISITTSVTEGNILIITGRSLEAFLCDRIIRNDTILKGNLQNCIHQILNANAICPTPENRILPGLSFSPSTDPLVTALELDFELSAGDNLYDAIYVICEAYHLGFRVLPTENGMMEFSLYTGKDRSYAQTTNPWIVFSPKYENIKESEMNIDVSNQKTVIISDQKYKRQEASGESVDDVMTVEIGSELYGFDRKEMYKSSNVSIESVDKSQFGEATDRVNIRDYQTWEVVYFDSAGYQAAMDEWAAKCAARNPKYTVKQERTEWRQVEKTGSNEPGWQEAHPNESPYTWVLNTIPGDDAATIARKNSAYNSMLSKEPSRRDFEKWGWVLTDPGGYADALRKAQEEIDAEFMAVVNDKINSARSTMTSQCEAELSKYLAITTFSGELDSTIQSVFGVDYFLGDIVQFVNEFNFQATTRVVGMTYSQDSSNGYTATPTFKSDDEAVFDV